MDRLFPFWLPEDVGLFVILMHYGIVLHSARNVSPWGGHLHLLIRTLITKEWYIVVSSLAYLHICPQVISKCTYLCRSIDLFLSYIKDAEVLETFLDEEALQTRHIEEEEYGLCLLGQLDVTLKTSACSDASTGAP